MTWRPRHDTKRLAPIQGPVIAVVDVKPDDSDIRCSTACTRAGISILLFSALSLLMIQPVQRVRQFAAYFDYVSHRLVLKEDLGRLEHDRAWRGLSRSPEGGAAKATWTLDKLLAYRFEDSSVPSMPIPPGLLPSLSAEDARKEEERRRLPIPPALPYVQRPDAPINATISVTLKIEPLHRMVDALIRLGDGKRLAIARSYSGRADRAIYDWTILRSRLLWAGVFVVPVENQSGYYEIVTRDQITSKLRFPDLVELAEFEPPTLTDVEALLKERSSVTLPSLGIPIGLIEGTTTVELGMLLSLFYFWLYYSEARRSVRFPADATLFGVFARNRVTRSAFIVFLLAPLVLAVVLATVTWFTRQLNGAIAVLIVTMGGLIAHVGLWFPTNPDDDFF